VNDGGRSGRGSCSRLVRRFFLPLALRKTVGLSPLAALPLGTALHTAGSQGITLFAETLPVLLKTKVALREWR
jgi:hypothetical protein